jgi:hypothetical protein
MRMLLDVEFPHEPFNTLVREGKAGAVLNEIMEDLKPEAVYFTERDGRRHTILVLDLASPSDVPRIAEPFFLRFQADCRFRVVMSPDDLANAGLDGLGEKWG